MKNFLLSALALSAILLFTSCGAIMGLKQPRHLSDEEIIRLAKKYKIPAADCYELDSNYLLFSLQAEQQQSEKKYKDFSQPLQIRYYDTDDGFLQSFYINCYADRGLAGIVFGLDWNKKGCMDLFPPLQQAPLDSLLPLNNLLYYMRKLRTTGPFKPVDYDYVVVVYWNRMMGKHVPRMVNQVKRNVRKAGKYKVKVLYANNENLFRGHYFSKFTPEDTGKYDIDFQKLIMPQAP